MDEIRLPWPAWKIERLIGEGSFGKVYEISRMDPFGIEEHSALKIVRIPKNDSEITSMREEGFQEESIRRYNQQIRDSIIREYSVLMQLKGHRSVVRCDDCESVPHENDIGWDMFIRMELLTPLTSVMMERNLSENEILRLGEDMCRALIACEENGIIHCDIKPGNILLNQYGDFKLGDFGIARTMDSTYDGRRYGTYNYMAPEVYHKLEYGPAADIYSLGMVMHYLLNNYRRPFAPMDEPTSYQEQTESNVRRLHGKEPIPDPVRGNEKLKQAVRKACAYEPMDRFQTAEEFLEALQFSANDVEEKNAENRDEMVLSPDEMGQEDFDWELFENTVEEFDCSEPEEQSESGEGSPSENTQVSVIYTVKLYEFRRKTQGFEDHLAQQLIQFVKNDFPTEPPVPYELALQLHNGKPWAQWKPEQSDCIEFLEEEEVIRSVIITEEIDPEFDSGEYIDSVSELFLVDMLDDTYHWGKDEETDREKAFSVLSDNKHMSEESRCFSERYRVCAFQAYSTRIAFWYDHYSEKLEIYNRGGREIVRTIGTYGENGIQ